MSPIGDSAVRCVLTASDSQPFVGARGPVPLLLGSVTLTLEYRYEHGDGEPVFRTSRRGLDLNQRPQVENTNGQPLILNEDRVLDELVKPPTVVQLAENIQWSESRGEVELTSPKEVCDSGSELPLHRLDYPGIQGLKQGLQPLGVLGLPTRDDVEVDCRHRRSVKNRRQASNDDEVDLCGGQRLKQCLEVSVFGSSHGADD